MLKSVWKTAAILVPPAEGVVIVLGRPVRAGGVVQQPGASAHLSLSTRQAVTLPGEGQADFRNDNGFTKGAQRTPYTTSGQITYQSSKQGHLTPQSADTPVTYCSVQRLQRHPLPRPCVLNIKVLREWQTTISAHSCHVSWAILTSYPHIDRSPWHIQTNWQAQSNIRTLQAADSACEIFLEQDYYGWQIGHQCNRLFFLGVWWSECSGVQHK